MESVVLSSLQQSSELLIKLHAKTVGCGSDTTSVHISCYTRLRLALLHEIQAVPKKTAVWRSSITCILRISSRQSTCTGCRVRLVGGPVSGAPPPSDVPDVSRCTVCVAGLGPVRWLSACWCGGGQGLGWIVVNFDPSEAAATSADRINVAVQRVARMRMRPIRFPHSKPKAGSSSCRRRMPHVPFLPTARLDKPM